MFGEKGLENWKGGKELQSRKVEKLLQFVVSYS